jgi:flavin reductase (DIM6/NTAB) family NADH-FMN oxidoreductase RutF
MFCFSSGYRRGSPKDTTNNIRATRSFVVNVVPEHFIEKILVAAKEFSSDIDEIQEAGFTPVKSEKVSPPRIAESPISMECNLRHEIGLGMTHNLFIGEILCFHIRDELLKDGAIDTEKFYPLGRLVGDYYCSTKQHIIRERTWTSGHAIEHSTEA